MRSESPNAIWKMAISNEAQSELKFFQKILRDEDSSAFPSFSYYDGNQG